MKNMSHLSKRPARARQAGFIQNFIIPGIILIGVVIAGIAMLSSGSSTNTDNEKAGMLANVVLTQSLTVTGAIQRAEADGGITSASTSAEAMTALTAAKYMGTLPTLPPDLTAAGTWGYDQTATLLAKGSGGADIGSAAADTVLSVKLGADTSGGVAEAVCLRVNNKLYGTSTSIVAASVAAAVGLKSATEVKPPVSVGSTISVGGSEGCAKEGTNYVYYKVVTVK